MFAHGIFNSEGDNKKTPESLPTKSICKSENRALLHHHTASIWF